MQVKVSGFVSGNPSPHRLGDKAFCLRHNASRGFTEGAALPAKNSCRPCLRCYSERGPVLPVKDELGRLPKQRKVVPRSHSLH